MKKNVLPLELRSLVHWSVGLLGQAIKEELGSQTYQRVERIRQEMKSLRGMGQKKIGQLLHRRLATLRKISPEEQYRLAHSFSVMLELINCCENAYRTFRWRQKGKGERAKENSREKTPGTIIYVLTAHPTEARGAPSLFVFRELQDLLVESLEGRHEDFEDLISHWLRLSLKVPMARHHRPTVEDEANHIFSILLREEILMALVETHRKNREVYLRTWVGGDKDGHPLVNAKIMLKTIGQSRERLLQFIKTRLQSLISGLSVFHESTIPEMKEAEALQGQLRKLLRQLNGKGLSRIGPGDGRKLTLLKEELRRLGRIYEKLSGGPGPEWIQLKFIMKMFPGLMIPLELRESRELFLDGSPIALMLKEIGRISRGGHPHWYVRGLVVSQVEDMEDLKRAALLMKKTLGSFSLPVIPLFENEASLRNAHQIAKEFLSLPWVRSRVMKDWFSRFEVMVGYSDSAKEMGVLPGRYLIAEAMKRLERELSRLGIKTLFFHGSGGSVDRGGGSIQEQTEWWPSSSREIYKATIQGEMVQRSFATREIVESQLEKISWAQAQKSRPLRAEKALELFARKVSLKYKAQVGGAEFLQMVEVATPYRFLNLLRIGSRPSKRKKTGNLTLSSLRAIPWILCWTQSRALFPTWWGIGSAYKELSPAEKSQLKTLFRQNAFFRSFIKLLAFTLRKVELPVWNLYLEQSALGPAEAQRFSQDFRQEFSLAKACVGDITGQKELLWYRPWLETSINLRSTMIHPLNLLQILALEKGRKDLRLLRETVTGIACGMLTTG